MAEQIAKFKADFNSALAKIQEDPNSQMPKTGLGVVTFLVSQEQHKLTVVTVFKNDRPYREITLVSQPLDDTLKELFPGTAIKKPTGLRTRNVQFVHTKDSVWVMPTRIGIRNDGPLTKLPEPQLSPIDDSEWQSVTKTAGYSQVYHTPITFVMEYISSLNPAQFERWVIYPLVAAITLLRLHDKSHNNIGIDNVRCVLKSPSLKVRLAGFEACTNLDEDNERSDYDSLIRLFDVFIDTRPPKQSYLYQNLEEDTFGCLWTTYHTYAKKQITQLEYINTAAFTNEKELELNGIKEETLLLVGHPTVDDLADDGLFDGPWTAAATMDSSQQQPPWTAAMDSSSHGQQPPRSPAQKRQRSSSSPTPIGGGNGRPGTQSTTSSGVYPVDPTEYQDEDIPNLNEFERGV